MYRFERFPYADAIRRYERVRLDLTHPDHRPASVALACICRSVGPTEADGVVYSWDFWQQSLCRARSAGTPRNRPRVYAPRRVYRTPTVA